MQSSKQSLHLFVLVMLIVGAIDSIRNMPATALFGSVLIFFFVFSAIFFLIPTALVSAELASTMPEKNGIYDWVTTAFGHRIGFLTIWLQWINTMVWYPTILSFIAGTLAYLIDPALANHKGYLVVVILGVYWALTLLNLQGLSVSAKFASFCAVVGMAFPMVVMIVLALYWVCSGHALQVHFTAESMLPHLNHTNSWISLTAVMTSFLGIELSAVHIKKIVNPRRTFPVAMLIAVIFILLTMVMGSLAIAFVIPQAQINLVSGVMQGFSAFLTAYHLHALLPVLTILIIVSAIGSMVNWMIAPAKGLLLAGEVGYLPKWLCRINRHDVPGNLLLLQAVLVSVVCLAFLLMPSVNGSYWVLTDLSTELYMMMYVLLFLAAIALKWRQQQLFRLKNTFMVPGKQWGMLLVCMMGLLGSLLTIIVGFIPPENIPVGGAWHYEWVFVSGLFLMLLPLLFFYLGVRGS